MRRIHSTPVASSASSILVRSAILFLLHCIALASGSTVVAGPDGGCHRSVSTKPAKITNSGNGIAFAIRSDVANEDELVITSFGFHVDPEYLFNNGTKIEYELYVLKDTGYYASPERNPEATMLISEDADPNFDYRGDVEESWDLITEGQIRQGDLTETNTTLSIQGDDFFQIPLGSFAGVGVPAAGGVRSFYIATKSGTFIFASPDEGYAGYYEGFEGYAVNDETRLAVGDDDDDPRKPEVLIGEGVITTYPMPDNPYYYQTNSFVGTVYYEAVCPSAAPSISAQPSGQPNVPSQRPSAHPSIQPSMQPTVFFVATIAGLMVSLPIECDPAEEVSLPPEEIAIVAASVQAIAEDQGAEADIYNIEATVVNTYCVISRRLATDSADAVARRARAGEGPRRRRLPSGSSAVDFTVVITGDYRPPSRDDEPPDLGGLTEDSINRDGGKAFVKDLKERAKTSTRFAAVESVVVESFEVPVVEGKTMEETLEYLKETLRRKPTTAPTGAPSSDSILNISLYSRGKLAIASLSMLILGLW